MLARYQFSAGGQVGRGGRQRELGRSTARGQVHPVSSCDRNAQSSAARPVSATSGMEEPEHVPRLLELLDLAAEVAGRMKWTTH